MKKLALLLLACLLFASVALGEGNICYVNNERGLIIRESPDFDAPIVGYIPFKEDVTVFEELDNGFAKLVFGELTGYSWAYYLTEENISEIGDRLMYVTSWTGLNLHEQASIESDIITGVPFGTQVTVKEYSELFSRCYVMLEDKLYKGYLWTGYLSSDTPDAAHAKAHHDAIVGTDEDDSGDWDWSW